jgi:hypothetical protein
MRTSNRLILAATLACAALIAGAASASAPPTISVTNNSLPLPTGQVIVDDFDNPVAAGFSFTPISGTVLRSGSLGVASGVSAPPPGDLTNYFTVLGGGSAMLTALNGLTSFSFFMGSPDSYNSIEFIGDGGYDVTLSGSNLFQPATAFGGDQSIGRRVNYDFGSQVVNQVVFRSSGNSFEFDDLAAKTAGGVPEPATWAFLIMGLGGVGAAMRRQRRSPALALVRT